MAGTRGAAKRSRAESADRASEAPVSEPVDTAPPPSKRAATSSKKGKAVADNADSDPDFSDLSADNLSEEEEVELTPEEIQDAIINGEMDVSEEDADDAEEPAEDSDVEEEEGEQDESSFEQLDAELFNIPIDNADVERFWVRIRQIIMALQALAMGLPAGRFFFRGPGTRPSEPTPISGQWWSFLCKVDVDYLMQMYRDAVPPHVQTVLGQQEFGLIDLLRLVGNWRDPSWGVYMDILTNLIKDWYQLYVGSGTTKGTPDRPGSSGFWRRICTYFKWIENRIFPAKHEQIIKEGGAHGHAMLDSNVQIQFVKLARFSADTPRTYVLFYETLMMIYLQTFKSRKVSRYASSEAYDWAEKCRLEDLFSINPNIDLNRAWTLSHLIGAKAPKDRICSHCGSQNESRNGDKYGWFHRDSTRPYTSMLCLSCYRIRYRNGKLPLIIEIDGTRRKVGASYRPEMHEHDCVSCGEAGRKRGTIPDSAMDGKFRCAQCRLHLQHGLDRLENGLQRTAQASFNDRESAIAYYSRHELPLAPKSRVDTAAKQTSACAHCGSFTQKGRIPHTEVDGKIRCSACRTSLNKDLKTLEKTPKKMAHLPRFKDRETMIAHYSAYGANKVANQRYKYDAAAHVYPCINCAKKPTQPHTTADGKYRCSKCRGALNAVLKKFDEGRSKNWQSRGAVIAAYCKNETSTSSS